MRRIEAISQLKIHTILWFLAAIMLFAGIMNFHGSIDLRDYRCLDGEVIDIKAFKVLQKSGYVTRYSYTIVWYDEGIRYEQSVHEDMERPDESQTKVWVNADNTDASLGDAASARESAYIDLSVAMTAFILGLLFAPRGNKKREKSVEEMESTYTGAILMAILMVISDLFMIFLYCKTKSEHIYVTPVFWDLGGAFTIVLVICSVIIVKLRKKLKESK